MIGTACHRGYCDKINEDEVGGRWENWIRDFNWRS